MKIWVEKEAKNVFAGAKIRIDGKECRVVGTRQRGGFIHINTEEFGSLVYLVDEKVEVWL